MHDGGEQMVNIFFALSSFQEVMFASATVNQMSLEITKNISAMFL